MLFLLHGFGADEQDLLPLAASLPPELVVVSFRAPYANPDSGYRWYDNHKQNGQTDADASQLLASETAVLKRIRELTATFQGDPQRIFIGGFSQGAVVSYLIGLSNPDRFRGVIVLSGAILPAVAKLLAAKGEGSARRHIPFFVGHGSADRTVPFADADQSAMLLAGWHVPLTFHRYDGMGHATNEQEIADLDAWLQGLE
jgi:phospholipase/carboxylesterase